MLDPRIIALELDERTIIARTGNVDEERRVAALDLLAGNHFAPCRTYPGGYAGPYRITLRIEDGRLALDIATAGGERLETILLALGRFRRAIRDYFAILDSYRSVQSDALPHALETVDMARRALHNDAAELLMTALAGKVSLDFDTARRLFTLICALHVRG